MLKQKKTISYTIYVLFITIPLLFFSCYPGGIEYYNESDIILTMYDDQFDFADNSNYFMPDTIIHAIEEGEEDNISRAYDGPILDQIADQMSAAGYTRLESNIITDSVLVDSADVVLSVVITSSEYTGIGYIPGGGGYWGWYPGWGWGGGYYPGYPWCPGYGWGYPYTYSYSTGSLFIEMIDQNSINYQGDNNELPITWQATINGMLSGNQNNMQWRIDNGIEQCFKQSPYLSN